MHHSDVDMGRDRPSHALGPYPRSGHAHRGGPASEKAARFRSRRSFRDWPGPATLRSNGPTADLTLSTQGLARALTKTLLSETLGPEVAITFRPGTMVMTIDERILARGAPRGVAAPARPSGRTRRRSRAQTAVLRHARPEIVSTQRPDAADRLPGPRPEFLVGRVCSHDPLARRSRLRDRGLRLSVQPEHRGVVPGIRTRLGRVSGRGQGQAPLVDRGALDGCASGAVAGRRRAAWAGATSAR